MITQPLLHTREDTAPLDLYYMSSEFATSEFKSFNILSIRYIVPNTMRTVRRASCLSFSSHVRC